jgi:hypothetical protein
LRSYYITAKEAASILNLSEGKTYELFRQMNAELKAAGYMTVAGRVPRAYFNKKFYGGIEQNEEPTKQNAC